MSTTSVCDLWVRLFILDNSSLFSLSQSGGWIQRPTSQFGVFSRRGVEGGGLGSPLAGFLSNTEISKLLDICPVFLLIFSPIKTADFWYYSSRQMMAILCCVANKGASAAHVQYTVYTECTRSHQLRKVTLRCHTNSVHWMPAIGPKILLLNWTKVTWRSQQTAYILSTELVWPRTFMVRSWCDHVKWLYGVQKSD
jgi:hypothetical protein